MSDPPRWLSRRDELPPRLRRGLEGLKNRGPDAARAELIRQRVAASIVSARAGASEERPPLRRRASAWVAASTGTLVWMATAAAATTGVAWFAASGSQSSAVVAPPTQRIQHRPPSPVSMATAQPTAERVTEAPLATSSTAAHRANTPKSMNSELALVREAQQAVRRDPARALTLVARHVKTHPVSALAEERELIAITALVKLGEGSEARQRAAAFRRRFPRSAYLHRLNSAVSDPAH